VRYTKCGTYRGKTATLTLTRRHPTDEMIAFHAIAFYSLENLFHVLDKTAAKDTGKKNKGRGFNNAT